MHVDKRIINVPPFMNKVYFLTWVLFFFLDNNELIPFQVALTLPILLSKYERKVVLLASHDRVIDMVLDFFILYPFGLVFGSNCDTFYSISFPH